MAEANTIQTNFTAGEVSPLMYGRVDVNKYFNGARKLRNFIVAPQGGAFRRPGTRFIVATKDSSKTSRLVRFCFNNDQSYQLEFGETYIRFIKNRAQITVSSTPVEVTTPYLATDLADLRFSQSADVIYITHPNYPVKKLNRFSDTSWTLTQPTFFDGPYLDSDATGTKAQVSLVSDITTLTIQGLTIGTGLFAIASTAIFAAGNVGKFVEYVVSVGATPQWNLLTVTAFTDSTHVTCSVPSIQYIYPTGSQTITLSGGKITSSVNQFFSNGSVGKYVRLTNSQAWYLITSFVSGSAGTQVNGTLQSIVSYTGGFNSDGSLTGTTVLLSNSSQFVAGDVGKYVEFRVGTRWHLAQILTVVSSTKVTVLVLDNLLLTNTAAVVTISGGTVTSDLSGVFAPTDIGKYVRATNSQVWVKVSAYSNTGSVSGTALTMFAYTYPGVIATLQADRVITVNCQFTGATVDTNDAGRLVRLRFGAQWRSLSVVTVSSTSLVQGTLNDYIPFDSDKPTQIYNTGYADEFRLGAWSVNTGYPAIGCFHQGRLGFAKTVAQPTTFWLSESDDYESFSPTDLLSLSVLDSNAITETIAYSQLNPIVWMQSGPVLLIGTGGSEFQVKPSSVNVILTPTNISVLPQTQFGAISSDPAYRVNSQTLFIQRGGVKFREMAYDFSIDAFISKDISIISEHLARLHGGLISATVMTNPYTIIWLILGDGMVVAVTYEREQDVIAWSPCQLGGSGIVESICCTPSATAADQDELYLIVKRTVNGATKRYIEVMERIPTPSSETDFANNFYVDCGITYTQSSGLKTTLSGLSHLEGCTVQVIVDGWYQGNAVVSSGVINVNKVCARIHVGLQCTATLQVLDPEGGAQSGTSQGKLKRMISCTARVLNTMNTFKQGPEETTLNRIEPPIVDTVPSTTAVPDPGEMVTDDLYFLVDDGFDNGGRIYLVMDDPYPFNVIALMPTMVVNA